MQKRPARRLYAILVSIFFLIGFSTAVMAADIYWTGAADIADGLSGPDGKFEFKQNWNPCALLSPIPDGNDNVVFDLSSTYQVFFQENHTNIDCLISNGFVTLRGNYTYSLTDDLITSSELSISDGLDVIIADGLSVRSNTTEIESGSNVTADNLNVSGSSGDAALEVNDGTLTVNISSYIGSAKGYTGEFNIINGGSAVLNGVLDIGALRPFPCGSLNIYNGSVMAENINIGTSGENLSVGRILISGAGADLQTGNSQTINIGSSNRGMGIMTIQNSGTFTSGTSNTVTVHPTGIIVNDGNFALDGDLNVNGSARTSTALCVGEYNQNTEGSLTIKIGGNSTGSYGAVDADSSINLSGELEIILIDGFVPAIGDQFNILNCSKKLTGTFDTVTLPDISDYGLAWNTSKLYSAGRLNIIPRHFTIYVDDDNTGFEDGTAAYPFNTIQEGVDAAYFGDTVQVAAGNYSGGNITMRNGISIIGAGPELTEIIGGSYSFSLLFKNISELTKVENVTIQNSNAYPAAIDLDQSNVELSNCVIRDTAVSGSLTGPVSVDSDSTLSAYNCLFYNNTARAGSYFGGRGGAINNSGNVYLYFCKFIGNKAYALEEDTSLMLGNGGAIFMEGEASTTIVNCLFYDNYADKWGGAICNGDPSIVGSLGGTLSIFNSTLAYDQTALGGPEGGNEIVHDWGTQKIYNCILAIDNGSSDLTIGWGGSSDIQYSYFYIPGYANNPRLLTDTSDTNPMNWTITLKPGSPCIDSGSNALIPAGISTDLTGGPRLIDDPYTDDTGNGTPPITDMGAYELNTIGLDTDDDNMDDGWEIQHFGDTTSSDGSGHHDTDSLTDLEEFQNSTDPNNEDTDNDGLDDGDELDMWSQMDCSSIGCSDCLSCDIDGDGQVNNLLDDDADGDGVLDGTDAEPSNFTAHCNWDFDKDNDIDGSDLWGFLSRIESEYTLNDLIEFLDAFGKEQCSGSY